MSDCNNCKKTNELMAMLSDQRESINAWDRLATKEASTNRELSKKYYHLRNLFDNLRVYAEQAIEELERHDQDSVESIKSDIDCLMEEAKANGFID